MSSDAAYHLEVRARLAEATTSVTRLRVSLTSADDNVVTRDLVVTGSDYLNQELIVPEVGAAPKRIRIEADAGNTVAVLVHEIRLWNHLMATGVVDYHGAPRRSRALAYGEANHLWQAYEAGLGVPAAFDTSLVPGKAGPCSSGVYSDGWMGRQAVLPVYVPATSGAVALTCYLPDKDSDPSPMELQIGFRENAAGARTVKLDRGRNTILIAVESPQQIVGDRLLSIRTSRKLATTGGDGRELSILLDRVEFEGISKLEMKTPFAGTVAAQLSGGDQNRVILRGRVLGKAPTRIEFHVRGHASRFIDAPGDAMWTVTLPLWRELFGTRSEIYITTASDAPARVTVDDIAGESERTPNDVYR